MIVNEMLNLERTGSIPDTESLLSQDPYNLRVETSSDSILNSYEASNYQILNNASIADTNQTLATSTNTEKITTATAIDSVDIGTNNNLTNSTTKIDPITGTKITEAIVAGEPFLEKTAKSAASFVDSIATSGVNKKYEWDRVKAIADDIGIKHFRNLTKDENGIGTGVDRLIGNKYTYTVSVGNNTKALDPSPQAVSQLLEEIKNKHRNYKGRLTALEGPNEYDYIDPAKDPNWAKTLTAFVKELYQQMRAAPWFDEIPYVGPSFYRDRNMQQLPDISQYIDAGNLHLYTRPPVAGDRSKVKYSGYLSGNLPLYVTEIGNNTKTATEELEQARLYPRMFLVNFNRGIIRSHSHVLIDSDSTSSNGQKRYGIVRSDFTYKPAAVALKNTIGLLEDSEQYLTDFRFLDFSLTADSQDLQQTLLYHSSKDKYYLALWQGVFNDTATDAPSIPVTVNFQDNIASVAAYKPNDRSSGKNVPINNNSVTVKINDKVTFLEITLNETFSPPPVAPSQLTATDIGPTAVRLTWQDNSNNEAGFGIERNDGLFGWRLIGTVDANVTSSIDRTEADRKYRYRVRGVNAGGHSDYTNTVSYNAPIAQTITDPLANFKSIAQKSTGWSIDAPQTNPAKFDGDLTLASSTSSAPQYLTYYQPALRDFTVVGYTKSDRTDYPVSYYSSDDGVNWLPIEVNSVAVPTVPNQNNDVVFTTPKAILPSSNQYLKIELNRSSYSDFELGQVKLKI